MGFAARVSDRVVFLADGRIEEQGTPEQLFGNPQSLRLRQFLASWNERQSGNSLPAAATPQTRASKQTLDGAE